MEGNRQGRTADGFWRGARVLVTGGAGFIGTAVVRALQRRGVADEHIVIPRSRSCDLRLAEQCRQAIRGCDVVIHLAAPTGGISFSRAHPASQYRDCSLINLHMLEAARAARPRTFVSMGNLLAYPATAPSPLREETLYDGAIADTHLGIGLAKRDLVTLGEMYHREFGVAAVTLLTANAYGPGDHFDSPHPHVIPATIIKCFRDEDLTVWGDGSPTRDFLYVDDIAEALLTAAEHLQPPAVVNVASGTEVSIADLVNTIAMLTGFRRPILFDPSKGGGDPRRVASTDRSTRLLGFVPQVALEEGLRRTIAWYQQQLTGR